MCHLKIVLQLFCWFHQKGFKKLLNSPKIPVNSLMDSGLYKVKEKLLQIKSRKLQLKVQSLQIWYIDQVYDLLIINSAYTFPLQCKVLSLWWISLSQKNSACLSGLNILLRKLYANIHAWLVVCMHPLQWPILPFKSDVRWLVQPWSEHFASHSCCQMQQSMHFTNNLVQPRSRFKQHSCLLCRALFKRDSCFDIRR